MLNTTYVDYIWVYLKLATRLGSFDNGRRWFELSVDVCLAAAFANRGFLPDEATTLLKACWMRDGAVFESDMQDVSSPMPRS